jgi:hypothetical protein
VARARDATLFRVSRSRLAGVLIALLLATACGRPEALSAGPVDLPAKPADYVDVFTWSQGVPAGAKPVDGVFKGPHFSYRFGALAVRGTIDETSGALEGGPARAADGHEFLVLYRLQGDDTFAPPPEAPLEVNVLVGTARKRLPKSILPGTGLIVSVPTGGDAILEVTDDKPYQYSVRNGSGPVTATAPGASSSAGPPSSGTASAGKQVTWQDGDYTGQGSYQGVRTSGPLGVTLDLGDRSELGASLAGAGAPPAKQIWLRLPEAKISTDDNELKVDLARSVSLTLPNGDKVTPKPSTSGLLFAVPDPFTAGVLTIAPEFPAGSTAKWTTKPTPKEIQVTVS